MNIDSVDWLGTLTTKNRIDRYPGFYSPVINIFYHFIMADTHRRATLRGFIADLLAASPATPPMDLLKVSTGVSCSKSISFTSDQKTNYQGCSLPQVECSSNSKNRKLFASICFPIKPEQNEKYSKFLTLFSLQTVRGCALLCALSYWDQLHRSSHEGSALHIPRWLL